MFKKEKTEKAVNAKGQEALNALLDIPIAIMWVIKTFIKASPFLIIPLAITVVIFYFAFPDIYQQIAKIFT